MHRRVIGLLFILAQICITSASIQLPAELTHDTYDAEVSRNFTFVEFYSPYCSHCKQLAPTWESLYSNFSGEATDMGLKIRQVNCVESGDLCNREGIQFYPSLRLYREGKLITSYPNKLKRTTDAFEKFLRQEVLIASQQGGGLPHRSARISSTEMIELIAGKNTAPKLVSFWPSTDEQLTEENFDSVVLGNCPECVDLKTVWSRVSNIFDYPKTGFFNCRSNHEICNAMGLESLVVKTRKLKSPKIFMFLPTQDGGNRIVFKGDYSLDGLKKWTERLMEIAPLQDLSVTEFASKLELVTSLPHRPSMDENKNSIVSFVYLYEEDSSTPEDFVLLPHLIQSIMDLKAEVRLYKSSDKGFIDLVASQYEGLIHYTHWNESEPERDFDKRAFISQTYSSKPTFLCFKDQSLVPSVFKNFASKEVRSYDHVMGFVKQNAMPLLGELSSKNLDLYFPTYEEKIHSSEDKVVVLFASSTGLGEELYKGSILAHDYSFLRTKLIFNRLTLARHERDVAVTKMRAKGSSADSVSKKMYQKLDIPDNGDVIFCYISPSKWRRLNLGYGNFKSGDAIVISRFGDSFWNKDIYGNKLKSDLFTLRETLAHLNFGDIYNAAEHAGIARVRTQSKLKNSPYSDTLRFMDSIHRYGLVGYLFCFLALVFVLTCVGHYRHKRRVFHQKGRGLGILGTAPVTQPGNRISKFD